MNFRVPQGEEHFLTR